MYIFFLHTNMMNMTKPSSMLYVSERYHMPYPGCIKLMISSNQLSPITTDNFKYTTSLETEGFNKIMIILAACPGTCPWPWRDPHTHQVKTIGKLFYFTSISTGILDGIWILNGMSIWIIQKVIYKYWYSLEYEVIYLYKN